MEMQQDGSLKSAVQEALGMKVDTKTAVQQRIKQLLDLKPVMLFMKVSSLADCLHFCHVASPVCGELRQNIEAACAQYTISLSAMPVRCMHQ